MTFRYVTGDLDQIDLTAPIYPNRDHTRGVALYGIDIAYLLEHKAAWYEFTTGNSLSVPFYRNLLKGELSLANPAGDYYSATDRIIKSNYVFQSKPSATTSDFLTAYADAFLTDIPTIKIPDAPRKEFLAQSFAFAAKKKRTYAHATSDGNYSCDITHVAGTAPIDPSTSYSGHPYWHEYESSSNGTRNGSVTHRENYQYSFSNIEVGSFQNVIFPYTAFYRFLKYKTVGGETEDDVYESWRGFQVFTATSATTNANLMYGIGESIMASHGYSPMIFSGTVDPDHYIWQRMYIGVYSPIIIKRFTTRFDF